MKRTLLAGLAGLFIFPALSQNNPPVALNDTVEVMAQIPAIIDVFANDYDPDGDAISLSWWMGPYAGDIDTSGGQIMYRSHYPNEEDHFRYTIQDDGNPQMTSEIAWVKITLLPNPDIPVGINDTFNLTELVTEELDILANDYDPNGDPLQIGEIKIVSPCQVEISEDSSYVIVTPGLTWSGTANFKYIAKEKGTGDSYVSNWTNVVLNIAANPDIPVPMPDTAFTKGGVPVKIPVLENDYDLQGDEFTIREFTQPQDGIVMRVGDSLLFNSDVSYTGYPLFQYNLQEIPDTGIYSKNTTVRVKVEKNPDCPVGVPDNAEGMTWSPIVIDVLANDYDINGDPLAVKDVQTTGTSEISGNMIIYTSTSIAYPRDTLYYRVMQSNYGIYYSEWTPVYIDLAPNPLLPVAVNDVITAPFAFPVTISPLDNDIPNSADSLILLFVNQPSSGEARKISDSLLTYRCYTNAGSRDSIEYIMGDKNDANLKAWGKIYIEISDHNYYDSLTINNINAGVNADGMLFGNLGQFPGQGIPGGFKPHFRYPAGAATNTLFNSILWIGGVTDPDSLHFAGERYRQIGADFQPGPVSDVYDNEYVSTYWKLWKLDKSEIEYHRNNWWKQGYEPVADIASWPGNGVTSNGQASQLAPYKDINSDGIYDPLQGDYPLIRGDQCLFFIMNDDQVHTESNGERLKAEIHGMVYGYDEPGDSVLSNTVFVHYDLYNRSDKTYYDTYIGLFTDMDIGTAWDDFIGSDVTRSSYFGYNGDAFDEDYITPYYSSKGYEGFPPAQSVTVLSGPKMDADGEDNPAGGCDYSVNGLNFGNDVTDDERMGLTGFVFMNYYAPEPYGHHDYYNLLKGIWRGGTHFNFGGNGYYTSPASVGPECNFLYPGDSDPLNFGTGCVPPNPPYNIDGFFWTDSISNIPGDRNGLGSMGPFTFKPGDVQEIELAYVVANSWAGNVSSVDKLMDYIDTLRYRVSQGEIIVPNDQLGVHEAPGIIDQIKIFPNPAGDFVYIELTGNIGPFEEFIIHDVSGKISASGNLISGTQYKISIEALQPGFYIITAKSDKLICSGKFIKK
jgi:hypothetical protein